MFEVEKLAYNLYINDYIFGNDNVRYEKEYFYREIQNNEYCLSYYNKALFIIRTNKINKIKERIKNVVIRII